MKIKADGSDLKLEAVVVQLRFSIEIPDEDLLAIELAEDILGKGPLSENTICDQLEKLLRAGRVDYSPHFGGQIVFSMDTEENTPLNHDKVRTIIKNQIIKARLHVERMRKRPNK